MLEADVASLTGKCAIRGNIHSASALSRKQSSGRRLARLGAPSRGRHGASADAKTVLEELCRGGAVVSEGPPIKEPVMLKKLMTLALLTSSLVLAACNTIEGAGEDVESVGEAAEDAVK